MLNDSEASVASHILITLHLYLTPGLIANYRMKLNAVFRFFALAQNDKAYKQKRPDKSGRFYYRVFIRCSYSPSHAETDQTEPQPLY